MLGNDIIDLNKAKTESNWQRNGYLNKIFNAEECSLILNSSKPDQMVWLLWSMKEAAYKIINRESLQRFYHPKKFSCQLNEGCRLVAFEGRVYFTQSSTSENLVHTIASPKKENLANIETYYAENRPDYVQEFNAKSRAFYIEKSASGIPSLIDKKTGKNYPASISHHGKYLAVIYPTS